MLPFGWRNLPKVYTFCSNYFKPQWWKMINFCSWSRIGKMWRAFSGHFKLRGVGVQPLSFMEHPRPKWHQVCLCSHAQHDSWRLPDFIASYTSDNSPQLVRKYFTLLICNREHHKLKFLTYSTSYMRIWWNTNGI